MSRAESHALPVAVGVDVGGTSTKGVVVDAGGRLLHVVRRPTPAPDPTGERVCAVVAEITRALDPTGGLPVGVDVPGIVDTDCGVVVRAVNLGWVDLPLRDLLDTAVGRPVVLEHDVRAAAVAELSDDATGSSDLSTRTFVAVGTGIAAATMHRGRLVVSGGWAGEIGQLVMPTGRYAGQMIEQVGSAAAIAAHAGAPDARTVVDRLDSDERARQAWADGISALALGIAALVVSVAPRTLVLGGGLAGAGDRLVQPLAKALREAVRTVELPELHLARHGDMAAALGASALALTSARRP